MCMEGRIVSDVSDQTKRVLKTGLELAGSLVARGGGEVLWERNAPR